VDRAGFEVGDARLAARRPGPLGPYNERGVLTAADVHVARCLGELSGDHDDDVLLASALAVRALRLGHVCVDLASVHRTVTSDVDPDADLAALPWPDGRAWVDRLAASPAVAVGDDGPADRPLRLVASRLYLDRYWRQERQVAAALLARAARPPEGIDEERLRAGLDRLFPAGSGPDDGPDLQRAGAEVAVRRRFTVVAGGPGTGKTTTVARLLALLDDQAGAIGAPPPRVALAAPTGKAAARLEQAVHDEAGRLPLDTAARARLLALRASTIHRLLGWRPDSHSRFRHDRDHRLPYDTVVVDETSMVSLSLMADLVDAVRPDARIVLVGDAEQLSSVEAGAVLGDIVGPAAFAARRGDPGPGPAGGFGDGIVVLRRVHRFGAGIARLADAVQRGDATAAVTALRSGDEGLGWVETADHGRPDRTTPDRTTPGGGTPGGGTPGSDRLGAVRDDVVSAGRRVVDAARAGDARLALSGLASVRVLCAHRSGPHGVGVWTERIEGWLRAAIAGYATASQWYLGRPLLVTDNDYELQLFNGDSGVVVAGPGGEAVAAFERSGGVVTVAPARLGPVQTLHAMTVHKSQGSQFDRVVVVLPDASSPLATRELLYTALTRARRRVVVIGSEAALRAAVGRPITRASGLRERLWGAGSD
jgi:exodeoxyribonuclease V alpha subunit